MKGVDFNAMLIVGALVLITSVVLLSGGGEGATITVDDNGGADHTTIQDAIDNATEGDTIRVYEGKYFENVVVDKRLSLIGNGSKNTSVDGGWKSSVITIDHDNVEISGFSCGNATVGISLESSFSTVIRNFFSGVGYGIYGYYNTNNHKIVNNTCSQANVGIILFSNHNTTLRDNICYENLNGIVLSSSTRSKLINNRCSQNSEFGIKIGDSSYITLSNNRMQGNGILLSGGSLFHWNTHDIDTSNLVDGKPIWYYKNTTGSVVTEKTSPIILANCSHAMVENNCITDVSIGILMGFSSNCTIFNNSCNNNSINGIRVYASENIFLSHNICTYNLLEGMYVEYSKNCTIEYNNASYNNVSGIVQDNSDANVIQNNFCSANEKEGVENSGMIISRSDNNVIRMNTLSNNSGKDGNNNGIRIRYTSSGNKILNNTCSNNDVGIWLDASDNIIANNTCSNNRYQGIYATLADNNILVRNSCLNNDNGIGLAESDNNYILDNNCSNNHSAGIIISYSNSNVVRNNTCFNNRGYGISIRDSDENTIVKNILARNRIGIRLRSSFNENHAHYNSIFDNIEYGIDASSGTEDTINATNNWWGDSSGPYHPETNPDGKGDNVTNDVVFDPWLTTPYSPPVASIESIHPSPATPADLITFQAHGITTAPIESYSWRSSLDTMIYTGEDPTFILKGLSIGNHSISLSIKDSTGTWSEEVTTSLIVHQRPIATIVSISPNSVLSGKSVEFLGNGSDDGAISRYVWISSIDGEIHNSTSHSFSRSDLTNGTHVITFKVQDDHGVWSPEITSTLTVNGKPLAFIDSTSPSPALFGEIITFIGHGNDDGGIEKYSWASSIDGVISSDPTFTLSNLSPGTHTITLRVSDALGTWSDPVYTNVTIHRRPECWIIAPLDGQVHNWTQQPAFTAGASNWTAIFRYVWSSNIEGELYNGSGNSFSPFSFSIRTHIITLRVMDIEGLWSDPVSITFFMNSKPIASIESIDPSSSPIGRNIRFTSNATDNGIISKYSWSSSITGELYNGSSFTFTIPLSTLGIHTITHVVRDNLGAWSDPVTMDIEVIPTPENMRPTVEITSHTNGTKISGTIVISGTASIADGTIDRVEISIDNGTWTTVTRFITWSHMVDTSTLTEGEHTVRVRSYDSIEYSEIVTITLIVEHDDSREGGGGWLIPGFGPVEFIVSLGTITILSQRRKGVTTCCSSGFT